MNKVIKVIISLFFILIIADRTNEYIYKYELVRNKNINRENEIQYYKDHPEEEYAGFERYPIYTIHSADIEWDDMYHMQAFKQLYKIPQDLDKIYFYVGEGEK